MIHPAFKHLPRDGLIAVTTRRIHLSENIPGGPGGWPPVASTAGKTTP
jgi:hypothetical protein